MQARLGSRRFKNKALADLGGQPVIWRVVTRAAQISGVDRVVLAVPESDRPAFVEAVRGCDVVVYGHRGPEADVLGRFLAVARRYRAETILRVTGDCPVLDAAVAGQVLELFRASQPCDFASNDTLMSGYPDGFDCAVFSRAALETAAAQATDPADREHIECWMKRPANGLRCRTLMAPESWAGPKLSIDTPDDLRMVCEWLAYEHDARG